MSGLCGVVSFGGLPVEPEVLERMAMISAHRGPGGIRYQLLGDVGLAHLALNATAESMRERQPLAAHGAWLVADARLDNRDDLTRELRARGLVQDQAPTDASLILAAYRCWQEACAEHLLGDFAFAIWDSSVRRLICARDQMGVKPLHYARVGPLLCFASEAQQVLQHPAVPRTLDDATLAEHLCGCDAVPGGTLFAHVGRVPPAHRLLATLDRVALERYWDVDPERRTAYRTEAEYAEHFRHLFTQAVSDRLRRPSGGVGVAMSGGLDSCSVAAVAHRCLGGSEGDSQVMACSFVFERLCGCDESEYIDAMEREVGAGVERIAAEDFLPLADPLSVHPPLEAPCQPWDSANREMNRRISEGGARVLLTGHGGDSLFSTNHHVYAARVRRGDLLAIQEWIRHTRVSGSRWRSRAYHYLFRPLAPRGLDELLRWLSRRRRPSPPIPQWIPSDLRARTGLAERLSSAAVPRRFRDAARQHVYETAVGAWSVRRAVYSRDRAAGAFGIEMRHPFLDRRLVEYVCSVPPEVLFRIGSYKPLLKRALADILPERLQHRQVKTKLGPFLDMGLRTGTRTIEALFRASALERLGLVDGTMLRTVLAEGAQAGVDGFDWRLWYAVSLELWLRQHLSVLEFQGSVGTETPR